MGKRVLVLFIVTSMFFLINLGAANAQVCGNADIETGEACDDGNTDNVDGCSSTCAVEPGWECEQEPSVCVEVCGNGVITVTEACDDDSTVNGDGCNSSCEVEE